jgi:hypothetical protein
MPLDGINANTDITAALLRAGDSEVTLGPAFGPPNMLAKTVAVTAGDKIEGLRQWASGRCLSADRAGVYSREQERAGTSVRRVMREPGGGELSSA